jgi:O-succinylhomoserine sulfhydrylase
MFEATKLMLGEVRMGTRPRDNKAWCAATRMVHAGGRRSQYGETSEALFLTSGFVYNGPAEAEARFKGEADGFIYSRYANPTLSTLEDRLTALEDAEAARLTASGMAAVAASIFSNLKAGDHIVAGDALFGSSLYILEELIPRFGMSATMVRCTNNQAWEEAIRPETKMLFFETPTNPTLEIVDMDFVGKLGAKIGATVVVDNVFSTPFRQRPMKYGADIVVYSATKHIDGQGRCLGGAILGQADYIEGPLHNYLKHTGPALSPFNAWVMLKGLETLQVRSDRHIESAAIIADYLANRTDVARVYYPGRIDHPQYEIAQRQMDGGGPLIAFDFAGGKEPAFKFLDNLKLILISNNLGDSKSLITHPATTTHLRVAPEQRAILGISEGLVRLSVGLEDPHDIIQDLEQALNSVD